MTGADGWMRKFEITILDLFLAGDDPVLACLREQLAAAHVARRERTEVGFFTHLSVPDSAGRVPAASDFVMDDVAAELGGTYRVVRFLLSVREGSLDFLEGLVLGTEWPEEAVLRRAYYLRRDRPGGNVVVETRLRDLDDLRRRWSGS